MKISRRGFIGALGAAPLAFTMKVETPKGVLAPVPDSPGPRAPTVTIRATLKTTDGELFQQEIKVDSESFLGTLLSPGQPYQAGTGHQRITFEAFSRPCTIASGLVEVFSEAGVLLMNSVIDFRTPILMPGDTATVLLPSPTITYD